ncbi:TIGR02302 family protein [Methylobacterium radiodurans]|uniref:TIGR02302 family protein n=1 Tax=Methylobacterium radiodurans TaxID=2202828 RepID=A0A2U8VS80_9HYPH|nr:TIGR02302 family protein [Methylobacterium radiodurans]AWN36311.1 TIGR02302 family protein [Methylobacterium radiodurans]
MEPRSQHDAGLTIAARLDRLVARARAAGLWERAWPVLWRGLGVLLAFAVVSWLGFWLDLGPVGRMAGVALFALALIAALLPLLRLARLSRAEALARLDREAARRDPALRHGPASAAEDRLAVGAADPATRALWELHQRRAAEAVARLRVGLPRPMMPRQDPYALRAALAVAAVASLFVAGPEWRERLGSAFDWRRPPAAAPNYRIDGWIDPPLYTRTPPLLVALSEAEQRLRAPFNSQLVVRIAGENRAAAETVLTPDAGLKPVPGKEARPDLREDRFQLVGPRAALTLATPAGERRLVIETIPDNPPEIRDVGTPEVNGRGTFNLGYRARDDYGLASADGIVEPLKPGRALVPPPRIALALPPDASGESEAKTLVDLTDNPWSGARVRFTLVVRDEAGQEARSVPVEMVLPARPFRDPLARSFAEERRRLVTGPDEGRPRVQTALDALLIAPDTFGVRPAIFLGLKTAAGRLRAARDEPGLTEVADLLWEMALKIEDGDLSDAEKQLRQAQDRLKEAVERSAPDEEIQRLTQDLKQALDKFLKEMAQRQSKEPRQQQQGERNGQQKSVTPDDLDKMLKDMAEAMKRGDTAEAQRLMEQLRNILENLQTAEQGGKSDQAGREMRKQMQELDQMSRDQQQLRDETFRDGQDKQQGQRPRDRGQQGQQQGQPGGQQGQQGQRSPGQQGQQGERGQGQQGGSAGDRQQALRQRLEDVQRRMKENGMKGEDGLADAEEAMREAENALRQGREGDAVDAQGRALDGLKRGAEGMQQQMQEMAEAEGQGQGEQPEGQQPGQQGKAGSREDDPLGRPTKGRDMSDGRVRVPGADESAVQRARRIMEELRRKLGDPTRSREELDYFERLLRRN